MKEKRNMEQKILEAAEKLFMEQGFMKTTTSQIAREAGCNQALVHYYYRTKEQLFEKIYGEKIQLLANSLINIQQNATTFEARMRGMIGTHFDFLRQHPTLAPFILRESLNNSEVTIKLLIGRFQRNMYIIANALEKELREEADKGNIRPISVVDLFMSMLSLNMVPTILTTLTQGGLKMNESEMEAFMEHRKEEAIETMLARLRK